MLRSIASTVAVAALLFFAGCGEPQRDAEVPLAPSFATEAAEECPIPADYVVSDEGQLLAALSAASPGHVIGLAAYFGITSDFFIVTDDITLTCATPGAGLYMAPGAEVEVLINVAAERVVVDRLVLDGSGTYWSYYAVNNGDSWLAQDVRFTNNTVTCGTSGCAFFVGVSGAIITDNDLEAPGSDSGFHLQGQGPRDEDGWSLRRTDGSRVERNTIVATAPQAPGCGYCGGIRPRDGRNLVVSHNTVQGPWLNSISTAMLYDSQISSNQLEGAQWNGIALSRYPTSDYSTVNNVFRSNQVNGSGFPGVRVLRACDNKFIDNDLTDNNLTGDEDIGMWLGWSSGANKLVRNNMNVVVDEGDFDCDGDGISDPNIIAGSGRLMSGIGLADKATEATTSHGKLQ
jgi:hypothetical protein